VTSFRLCRPSLQTVQCQIWQLVAVDIAKLNSSTRSTLLKEDEDEKGDDFCRKNVERPFDICSTRLCRNLKNQPCRILLCCQCDPMCNYCEQGPEKAVTLWHCQEIWRKFYLHPPEADSVQKLVRFLQKSHRFSYSLDNGSPCGDGLWTISAVSTYGAVQVLPLIVMECNSVNSATENCKLSCMESSLTPKLSMLN